MATVRMYDGLGYAKSSVSKGVEPKIAEAFAETNQEYLINDSATKEFARTEINASENRILKAIGKMLAVTVGAILAGIPIALSLLKLLSQLSSLPKNF